MAKLVVQDEKRSERDALDRLEAAIVSGGRGAGGAHDTLREAAVEAALGQGAEVMAVRHYPDLGPLQGIGALLRF